MGDTGNVVILYAKEPANYTEKEKEMDLYLVMPMVPLFSGEKLQLNATKEIWHDI